MRLIGGLCQTTKAFDKGVIITCVFLQKQEVRSMKYEESDISDP